MPVSMQTVWIYGEWESYQIPTVLQQKEERLLHEIQITSLSFGPISNNLFFISIPLVLKYLWEQHHLLNWRRVTKEELAITDDVIIACQKDKVIDGINVLGVPDNLF